MARIIIRAHAHMTSRVPGSGFKVQGSFLVHGSGYRVLGSAFVALGSTFIVLASAALFAQTVNWPLHNLDLAGGRL